MTDIVTIHPLFLGVMSSNTTISEQDINIKLLNSIIERKETIR